MTEVYVLDSEFKILGLIDGFTTLIWTRRYGDVGDFSLHLPGGWLFPLVSGGRYIYRADTGEAAMIERVAFERSDNGGSKVIASGRMLEGMLSERVIPYQIDIKGNAEEAIRQLVANNAISGIAEEGREISRLALGESSGAGNEVELQFEGENLLETVLKICNEQELSIKISFDFPTNQMLFSVWQGKDRTTAQRENSWAIFSDDFENINASSYEQDIKEYRNYAYVLGHFEEGGLVMVEVDNRLTDEEERREIYVDASDVKQVVDEETISNEEFFELLKQKGLESLAEWPMVMDATGDIRDGGNLIYRQDFDLGDLCEFVDNEVGIMSTGRITEVEEVIENNAVSVRATIGNSGSTLAKKIIRRERSV